MDDKYKGHCIKQGTILRISADYQRYIDRYGRFGVCDYHRAHELALSDNNIPADLPIGELPQICDGQKPEDYGYIKAW